MSQKWRADACHRAAITPATPVITLLATLALGTETLRVHAPSGRFQLTGLALCSMSACAMGLYKGPRLFGEPPTGANAPDNIPLGALFMLFNCVISALVQIVNRKALAEYPLLSSTACVEAFAVAWLACALPPACMHACMSACMLAWLHACTTRNTKPVLTAPCMLCSLLHSQ